MRKYWNPRLVLLAALLVLATARPSVAQPQTVASIKPVHALVAAVMAGVGTPELIVHGAASPHTYSLRPSDAQRLASARLVFWIGPIYEAFLTKPLATLAGGAQIVTLAEAPGIIVLPARSGGAWEPDEDEHDHAAQAHDHGALGGGDGHLWLDPRNAVAMVGAIELALARADPPHAAAYAANATATRQRFAALDAELAAKLAPVGRVRFIVFHDAYQYLERRYGLAAAGAIAVSPEQRPGARRVGELRTRITELGARCVFAEPQFEPALVKTLVAGTSARTGVLDPLGADIPDGPELYGTMMRQLAKSLVRCLGSG